jgi:hypothetical protein
MAGPDRLARCRKRGADNEESSNPHVHC